MPFNLTVARSSFVALLIACALGPLAGTSAQTGRRTPAAQPRAVAPAGLAARLDALPPEIQRQMLDPSTRFVESPGLVWRTPVVTVAFEGGSPAIYELIEATASEWTANGSRIRLSFRDGAGAWRQWSGTDTRARAAIRIGFRGGDAGGYWSAVGVTAEGVSPTRPTMNFGGFPAALAPYANGRRPDAWRASYYHTTILHEFGHALGLSHEHFHPDCQSTLDLPKVVDYLMRRSGWTLEQARFNADAAYYQAQVEAADVRYRLSFSPRIDRGSVMAYNLPAALVGSGSPCLVQDPAGYPTSLSEGDRRTFQRNYSPA